jgi:predicted transcriptional regulator
MLRRPPAVSTVLTVRVSSDVTRRLDRAARRTRRTRSEVARTILETALSGDPVQDPAAEARRQSRLANRRASEAEALDFIASAADLRGWR